ncbi:ArsR family transcriptional regulator [Frateuria sp. Soil773]|uniref:ArsR/SmtB family transcription factor n=1 Tax=Frateuria sp. Soil773 TaxID=1736407 RepID=UPI0006FAFA45|nr:metalloregulator ArsR/SmtB family transcription factor [Frateuria sp. Soil773]KRE99914.1 ArsR family transcriptional regulator [Frateuria sp. Soil773]
MRNPTDPARMRAHAGEAAALLKALANEQRLLILCHLAEGELSVGALQERVELGQSALSQHLARLRAHGLVATRREAQAVHYRLADGPVRALMDTLHGIYCAPRRKR